MLRHGPAARRRPAPGRATPDEGAARTPGAAPETVDGDARIRLERLPFPTALRQGRPRPPALRPPAAAAATPAPSHLLRAVGVIPIAIRVLPILSGPQASPPGTPRLQEAAEGG